MVMPAAAMPRYTIADLDDFPDDGNRYELLDGYLLVSPQAASSHQLVATRLATQLSNFLGDSEPAIVVGPGVVQREPNTHLEPDILVLPPVQGILPKWSEMTGHWLVVEVVSPSSRFKDRNIKRQAYLTLGVDEVWVVDHHDGVIERAVAGSDAVEIMADKLVWRPRRLERTLTIDIPYLFRAPVNAMSDWGT